jgi:hypothetical protein
MISQKNEDPTSFLDSYPEHGIKYSTLRSLKRLFRHQQL